MPEQITVFAENRSGSLQRVTGILAEKKINIRAMVIQDRNDFGIIKLLVSDPRGAHAALTKAGLAAALRSVTAVEIDDAPGGLDRFLRAIAGSGQNITDAYGFVLDSQKKAVWCVESLNAEALYAAIDSSGFRRLDDNELYRL